jgi:hypothetical protein
MAIVRMLPLVLTMTLALASAGGAAEICLVPSAANNRNITVACGGAGFDNDQIGYRTHGAPTCRDDVFCSAFGTFGWTISASPTDPLVNTGSLTPGASLYLWLHCDWTLRGMAAAEFDLAATGLTIVDLVPLNGFLNAGSDAQVLIVVAGCPSGSVVAGRIDVETTVGVTPVSWGRIKGAYR